MINQDVYLEVITELSEHFKKELSPMFVKALYKKLSEQLDTDEFLDATEKAITGRFFPDADQLIDSVLGTVEERAEREWQDIDTAFSVVGLKALNAIGGWWYIKHQCTQPAIARKDFIESYTRHAKGASREEFELPDIGWYLEPAKDDRKWSYLPVGTKRNKQTQQVETRWDKVYLDEAFAPDEIEQVDSNVWIFEYLDRYARRHLRLADGIHTRANTDVPYVWNHYAHPSIEWLDSRARLYLKNLEGTDNEF
jgi:hypothetical protein